MSEVVQFPPQLGSVNELLEEAGQVPLAEAMVAGYTESGDMYLRLSNMQVRDFATLHRQIGLILDNLILDPDP